MMPWCRLWNGTAMDPKFDVVSARSGVDRSRVLALWVYMMEVANQADPRGSLIGWNHEVVSVGLKIPLAEVHAVCKAMQGLMLDGNRLISWEKRQPKREDDSRDRVRKLRTEKALSGSVNDIKAVDDVTQCNAVKRNVTQDAFVSSLETPSCDAKNVIAINALGDVTQCNAPDTDKDTKKEPPKTSPKKSRKIQATDAATTAFNEAWMIYPRRDEDAYPPAREAFLALVRKGWPTRLLIQAAERYRSQKGSDSFRKGIVKFYRDGLWMVALGLDQRAKPDDEAVSNLMAGGSIPTVAKYAMSRAEQIELVKRFDEDQRWNEFQYGKPPGHRNCTIPPDVILEARRTMEHAAA